MCFDQPDFVRESNLQNATTAHTILYRNSLSKIAPQAREMKYIVVDIRNDRSDFTASDRLMLQESLPELLSNTLTGHIHAQIHGDLDSAVRPLSIKQSCEKSLIEQNNALQTMGSSRHSLQLYLQQQQEGTAVISRLEVCL